MIVAICKLVVIPIARVVVIRQFSVRQCVTHSGLSQVGGTQYTSKNGGLKNRESSGVFLHERQDEAFVVRELDRES